MKRFLEKAVKWLLTASGFVTSIVILLIIGFLFTEGAGLFREPVIEEGYVLALNRDNPVRELDAAQIKAVFDEDVTNWKELGGPDMPISTFRLEDADERFTEEQLGSQYENAGSLIAGLVASNPGMVAFVPETMIPEKERSSAEANGSPRPPRRPCSACSRCCSARSGSACSRFCSPCPSASA